MKIRFLLASLFSTKNRLVAMLAMALAIIAPTQALAAGPKPTVVLVHGAFADGSSWSKVILRLEKSGYDVIARSKTH